MVLLALWPAVARAQTADRASEVEAAQAELDGDYAQAMASDCALACKALGSMRRATDHLCALDPGDRCAKARQKLDAASDHVRATCPSCAEELQQPPRGPEPSAAPPPPTRTEEVAEQEAVVSKRGGCAGCATSPPAPLDVAPLALVIFAGLGLRARRRR